MAQKVTSTDIKLALKEFHNGKPSYFITECKTCSTYFPDPQGLLKFDGLAITKSYTKPNIIGYEIKVSRNDFLQDNKWHLYLQYCNEFYFVVPKGLVKKTGYTEAGATTVEIKKTVDGAEKTYASGTKVQVMVEQPVFYVKAVPVSSKNATSGKGKQYTKGRFYISPTPKAGFTAPRAFYDNHGIVQDKIYLSAFEGCIYDTDAKKYLTADEQVADFATDMLSSIAGVKPASGLTQNLTRANVRKLCTNRGTGWESHSIFAMAVTEWLLMIEYASLDAQRKVGRGVCDFTDDGKTDRKSVV